MKVLYDTHFPNAEDHRPGRNPDCPDSDILTLAWLLEYIGADSENAGYRRLKTELAPLFPSWFPERSRFNRRRRDLMAASEVLREKLRGYLPQPDVFIVASFPIPMCDVKRANTSTSDLKWAGGSGCLATYGHCATKGLETFFGFRGHVVATVEGVPVDFEFLSQAINSVLLRFNLRAKLLFNCPLDRVFGDARFRFRFYKGIRSFLYLR